MYIYENCTGGLFVTEDMLDYEESYCEACGDTASLIGDVENREDTYKLLKNEGWNKNYINEFINEYFDE